MSLAKELSTEIISADSRQLYRDIPIVTAAPTREMLAEVRHHLVGTLGLADYYSAARFEEEALSILPGIWQKSDVAIVCGGSMMYVDALLHGIDQMPTVSESTRSYVLRLYEQQGLDAVAAQLAILDPEYHEMVDRQNTRRVLHALEICLEAGVPYSSLRTGQTRKRPFRAIKMAINQPRETLFERINARVGRMIADGLEDEARHAWSLGNFNSLNTVGYKEMKQYFDGSMDRETAIARIGKNTRVYAKKQLTWLKKDPDVQWLAPQNAFNEACALIDAELNAPV